MSDYARVVADVPISLHKRAKRIAKRRRKTISDMIRDSLVREIERYEAEEVQEKEQVQQRGLVALRRMGEGQKPVEIPENKPVDRLQPTFERHAQRIAEVFDNPEEVRRRQAEAFSAIRKLAPLTYAEDNKIKERLESIIAAKADNDEEEPEAATHITHKPVARLPMPVPDPTSLDDPRSVLSALATMFGGGSAEPADDPILGKSIDSSRIKKRTTVKNEKENP